MRTDQLFKDLLRTFFADFLALFLPEVAAEIDPDSITFLDSELFTDIPEGEQRLADLVAQLRTRGGEPRLVLVHTEVQAQRQEDFGYRMWQYNALLRLREGLPTISVAVPLYPNTSGLSVERYTQRLFGRDYPLLDYWQVGLRDLRATDYLEAEEPLAAGLSALMEPGAEGRFGLKATILRRIDQAGLDPARVFLLVNVVESFLPLSAEEEAALWAQLRAEGVLRMATTDIPWGELTWADQMMERGAVLGERKALARVLRGRFGDLPPSLARLIETIEAQALDDLLDRAATAATLEEFGQGLAYER